MSRAEDTVTEKDEADRCEWCCFLTLYKKLDKARTSCSTGPSLSSSATYRRHITKAELSKQKIIETNKRMPCEAEYCNCTVREYVYSATEQTQFQ